MLEIIGAGVALVIAIILVLAARQPDICHIARSIFVAAPPERIFPLIDDLKAMNEWNPFATQKGVSNVYSGPERGVGAADDFSGGGSAGRIEIVESTEPSQVALSLRMDRPMRCENRVEFTIAPQNGGSLVTWDMKGRQPFIGKLFSLVMKPEKMVGGAFEQGLSDLKRLVETAREEAAE
ncbi:SRPBCC family protein [Methylosinus sp. LW4]|uniref:SRPBCC family protein n=1 Tax=Methylosinus sp. LW4 TaxID=136993 RepID=UPI00036336A7|nr:SRPBCC family protein [Methylosinus sp. LW4]